MRPVVIALGHFLMNDAAAGGHPLNVAGSDGAVIAHAVAMLDRSGQHIGDGLNAAMRMPGKSGEIVLRNVVAEVVEQQRMDRSRGCCRIRKRGEDELRRLRAWALDLMSRLTGEWTWGISSVKLTCF